MKSVFKFSFRTPGQIIFFAFASLFLFSSCHQKGCTNPLALNYNAAADQDDGSCIVCKTTQTQIDTTSVYLVDDNFSSPYFNQPVARFFLNQQSQTFSDNLCGKASSTVSLIVQSLINQSMSVDECILENFDGPLEIEYENSISLGPHQTINEGVIETINNPPVPSMAFDSIVVRPESQIIYH